MSDECPNAALHGERRGVVCQSCGFDPWADDPMPDDRPVSPEERLRRIMDDALRSLDAGRPIEAREYLRAALSAARPSSPTPEEPWAASLRVACMWCHAPAGKPCTTLAGDVLGRPHLERIRLVRPPGDDATTKEGR